MAKLPFFKFEAESWLTGKAQVLDVEKIGIYVNLLARIWRDGGKVENSRFLPRMIGCTPEQWQQALTDFIELGIVYEDEEKCLRVKFLDEQLAAHGEFLAKCSEAGKRGRRKVSEGYPQGTIKVPSRSEEGTSKHKKEERRKEKEDIREEREKEDAGAYAPETPAQNSSGSCVVPYPSAPAEVVAVANSIGKAMTEDQARAFIDYYAAFGWSIKGTPIRDWRRKVMTWCDMQRVIDARDAARSGNQADGLDRRDYSGF